MFGKAIPVKTTFLHIHLNQNVDVRTVQDVLRLPDSYVKSIQITQPRAGTRQAIRCANFTTAAVRYLQRHYANRADYSTHTFYIYHNHTAQVFIVSQPILGSL
jgi:hypothetical protein